MQPHSAQLGTGNIGRLLWSFSLPAIVGTMVHATYNIVDRIYLGHAVGHLGIAATTVSFPLMLILMAFGMLIAHGANSLISIRLGEGKPDAAEWYLGQAISLLIVLSIVFMAGGLLFLKPMLRLFGATADILPAAVDYMQIILLGTITHEISFAVNNFIRGEGSPRTAMVTMVIGAGLNLVLDPIFLFGFGWGMRGAAVATVLAQTVSATWVMWYYLGGRSQLKIRLSRMRLQWRLVADIAGLGSPPFAMQLVGSAIMALLNTQLARYGELQGPGGGDMAISAMGIIFSCNMVVFMPIIGLCMGMQPIVGYNHGALRFDRVRHCVKLAMVLATGVCLLSMVVIQVFPRQLVGLFGTDEPRLIALGAHGMRLYLAMLPVIGFQMIGAHYYQAVGKPKLAMLLTLSRQVVLLAPLLVILPRYFGLDGVWVAGPISDFGASLLAAIFIAREFAHLNRQPHTEPALLAD